MKAQFRAHRHSLPVSPCACVREWPPQPLKPWLCQCLLPPTPTCVPSCALAFQALDLCFCQLPPFEFPLQIHPLEEDSPESQSLK